MPAIIDRTLNFASVATLWDTPVSAGLETLSFLGIALPQSLVNLIPGGSATPLIAGGTPSVNAGSGMNISLANYVKTGVTQDSSETYMFAASGAYTTGAVVSKPFDNLAGGSASFVQCIFGSSGYPGPTFQLAYTNATPANAQLSASLSVGGANSAATNAALAVPNFYVAKVDMVNLVISFKSMSPAGISAGWGSGTGAISATIPAGSTRGPNTSPIQLGGQQNGTTGVATVHFFAKFNRATTVAEDAAMYAAVQTTLGLRGVTI